MLPSPSRRTERHPVRVMQKYRGMRCCQRSKRDVRLRIELNKRLIDNHAAMLPKVYHGMRGSFPNFSGECREFRGLTKCRLRESRLFRSKGEIEESASPGCRQRQATHTHTHTHTPGGGALARELTDNAEL